MQLGAKWGFWLSYNAYLQPLGTLVNLCIWVTNQEYEQRQPLREVFGPLLDDDGNLVYAVRRLLSPRIRPPTAADIEQRLGEWLQTYRRVRISVGHEQVDCRVVPPTADGGARGRPSAPPLVFNGSMLPCREEWIAMRDGEHAAQLLLRLARRCGGSVRW